MTPASAQAQKLKQLSKDNMTKQLDGPLKTMKGLEDKFSSVKQLHGQTYPLINGTKKALDKTMMLDTTSGSYPATAAAVVAIAGNVSATTAMKKLSDEYAKIKLKMVMPKEFAKTKLDGTLDYVNDDFDAEGQLDGIKDGIYDLQPDTEIIDEVNSELQEAGGKFDFTRENP